MSRGPDGGLRRMVMDHLSDWHCVPVEQSLGNRGTPDMEYAAPGGVGGWCEMKLTPTARVELRPEQCNWMVKRTRMGGRVTVVVRQQHSGGPIKGPPTDRLWLLDGRAAREIRERGLVAGAPYVLFASDEGSRRWDWERVREVLTRTIV